MLFDPDEAFRIKRDDSLLRSYRYVISNCRKEISDSRQKLEGSPSPEEMGKLLSTIRKCESMSTIYNTLLVNRYIELDTLISEHRHSILRCLSIEDVNLKIEELLPSQQQIFISYYLTKGLVYHDVPVINDVRVFWLVNTINMNHETTQELPSVFLLRMSLLRWIEVNPDTPRDVWDILARYDNLFDGNETVDLKIEELRDYTIIERRPNFFPLFEFLVRRRLLDKHELTFFEKDEEKDIQEYLALLDGYIPPKDDFLEYLALHYNG